MNLYGWQFRRNVQAALERAHGNYEAESALLDVSYSGFRCLLMALGVPALLLGAISIMPLS